jgi:hypothetical protein
MDLFLQWRILMCFGLYKRISFIDTAVFAFINTKAIRVDIHRIIIKSNKYAKHKIRRCISLQGYISLHLQMKESE